METDVFPFDPRVDPMRCPKQTRHPGSHLRDWLAEIGENQLWLAEQLGVSQKHVNEIINAKARVSVDLAPRIAQVTQTSAAAWVRCQADWDLARVVLRREARAS